jgi:hypothetical protein
MAQAIRIGPGQYTVNGKRYNARDSQTALKMAMPKATNTRRPPGVTGPQAPTQQNTTTAEVDQGARDVAGASFDAAMSSLQDPNNQVGQAFNPNLTARLSDGDLMANRQKVEDAAYARMTADYAKNKAFDSNALEQNLYNRGIPFDPQDQQRARWTGALDKRYDDLNIKARQDAMTQADAANASNIATNEGMRTNDYNIQQGTNQTQVGNFAALSGSGTQTAAGPINNAATTAAMDALKKKTPAEIALMNAQANAANRRPVGNGASSNQSAFG